MDRGLAVVTGAAKGIGEATARRFRREGHLVIGIATSAAPESLSTDAGVHWVQGDVADPDVWASVRDRYVALGAAPTALVLNAARALIGTTVTLELAEWRSLFEGNFFGAVLGAKTCLPDMITNGGGSVVVISSVNGWLAEQGLIAYSCTKAVLIEFARSIAVDHAREGIRANIVAPGTTDTPAFRRAMGTTVDPERFIAQRARRNPLGRILAADEIANVVWFLSDGESSGMTGAVVPVDAGLSASYDFRNPDDEGYRET